MTNTSIRRAGRTARLLALAAGLVPGLVAAATLSLGGTASATNGAATGDTTTAAGYHPGRDHMGSTIEQHEGKQQSGAQPMVSGLPGLDVSSYQGNVDWNTVKANGATFAYVKATESTNYQNPNFSQQYDGAYGVGLIRGAYHFAVPNASSGASQATYFAQHGGGWSADGKTLPGMLDIEYNPYGATCYGLSQSAMTSWIADFLNTYHSLTGRWATIYTTNDWWSTCTGNATNFNGNDPLNVACYCGSAGTLPGGWSFYTFWQFADSGTFPGDQDVFNGTADRLSALALG